MSVLDAHAAGLDAPDPPRGRPEQEDVAAVALDRKVLVERADDLPLRLGDHLILAEIGNRPAGGDGREPRPATASHDAVHLIAVEVRPTATAGGGNALGEHLDHGVEVLARQPPVAVSRAHQLEQLLLAPVVASGRRHDLLRQHVEGCLRDRDAVQLAAAHGTHEGRGLDQLVPRGGKEDPLGDRPHPMPRTTHPLKRDRYRARATDLTGEVDAADVDAQLERRRRHDRLEPAGLQLLLRVEAALSSEAAVVSQDRFVAEATPQVVGDALRQLSGADEHERGALLTNVPGELVVDLTPHLVGGDRAQLVSRDFDTELRLASMTDLDAPIRGADEAADLLERADGGRQRYALRPLTPVPLDQIVQPRQRKGQVGPPLVRGHRVHLVDDHGAYGLESRAARLGGEQDEERLGRGDEDGRWMLAHPLALARPRVAGADRGPNLRPGLARTSRQLGELAQGTVEVLGDVVRERLERRDIQDIHLLFELPLAPFPGQPVQGEEEGRERLARAGGRRDQDIVSFANRGPSLDLWLGRRPEALGEPALHQRMKRRERHGSRFYSPAGNERS